MGEVIKSNALISIIDYAMKADKKVLSGEAEVQNISPTHWSSLYSSYAKHMKGEGRNDHIKATDSPLM